MSICWNRALPSFPNSCSGMHSAKLLFRVWFLDGMRNGSFADDVPEQEFGNEERRPAVDHESASPRSSPGRYGMIPRRTASS